MKGKEIKVVPLLDKIDERFLMWVSGSFDTPEVRSAYISFKSAVIDSLKELDLDLRETCDSPEEYLKYSGLITKRFGVLPKEEG